MVLRRQGGFTHYDAHLARGRKDGTVFGRTGREAWK